MDLNTNNINFKRPSDGVITLNAKIKGFGKSSVSLSDNELIFKALEVNYTVKKSLDDMDYLIYSKGNFFFDDRIYMGINGEQYEITCNEDEISLRNLYDNILKTKTNNPSGSTKTISDEMVKNTSNLNQNYDSSNDVTNYSASDEIRKFYNLMNDGIISKEEFEEKKKELLKSKID